MPQLQSTRISKILVFSLILALLLAYIIQISPVLGAYIGPNRTVTETVQEGDGWGRECQLVGGSYQWVTTTTCDGCSASCADRLENQYPDSNPSSICNAAYLGSKVHDYSCSTVEREITYQPAAITASTSCAQAGNNGWCLSEAVVSLLGSEGADACGAYGLTLFEDNQANTAPASGCSASTSFTFINSGVYDYQAWVHSSLGDTSTVTGQTIKIDREPPGLSYAQPDLFTLALSGTDAHSGIDHFEANINGAGWVIGSTHTLLPGVNNIEMRAFDQAGNVTTDRVVIVTDNTPPEVLVDAITPNISNGSNGWYVTPPTITVSAEDSQTGIAFAGIVLNGVDYEASAGYTIGGGSHTIQIKAVDGAGNQRLEAPTSFANPLKVDLEDPVLLLDITPNPVNSDWYDQAVLLDASRSYDSVSGLDRIEIDLDGAGFSLASSVEILEGKHTAIVRVRDQAGNQVSESYTINVDLNPPYAHPTITGSKGPSATNGPWFSGAVIVAANAGDAAGGAVSVESSADGEPFVSGGVVGFSTHGTHTVRFRVTDPVGREIVETAAVGVDLIAPEIEITSHTDGDTIKDVLHLSGSAFDALSGLYQIELKVGDGDWNQYAPVIVDVDQGEAAWAYDISLSGMQGGPASFALRAQDRAGNHSPEQTIDLVVNNRAARLEIPDRWMAGFTIIPRHIQGDTGGVVRAVAAITHPRFGTQSIPLKAVNDWAFGWNGFFDAAQEWAPPGDYTVTVTSWDAYDNVSKDRGVIFVPELPDGPTQIATERIEVIGEVLSLDDRAVEVEGEVYQITVDSDIASGVGLGAVVYGEAELHTTLENAPAEILWLKLVVEVPIFGQVDVLETDRLRVDGQDYDLTEESILPVDLAPGLIVQGIGLDNGQGDPDIVWLERVAADPVPFSGTVTGYDPGAVLTVDGVPLEVGDETIMVTKSGLAVGDAVEGWYLEADLSLVFVEEIEPAAVAFEGLVAERTEAVVVIDREVYNIVETSLLPGELSAGHLVEGSALLFKDGHLELIEVSIIPGELVGAITRIEEDGEGGFHLVEIDHVPYLLADAVGRLRVGQSVSGWVGEDGRLVRLRVVSSVPAGLNVLLGLLFLFFLWLLVGRRYEGVVLTVDDEHQQFTLRLTDEIEDPKLRTLRYCKDLETAVRLNRGRRVRGRIVLFKARTMREVEV